MWGAVQPGDVVYKDMNGKPVEGEMYKLNHTHYYPRSQLAMTEAEHV